MDLDLADLRIEVLIEGDVEARLLGSSAMIGEVQALLDRGIQVDAATLSGALARVEKHVLDDGVGTPAMLDDPAEVAFEHPRDLLDLGPERAIEGCGLDRFVEFLDKLRREIGEVVDEVQRVLDLVRDTSGRPRCRSRASDSVATDYEAEPPGSAAFFGRTLP